MVKYTDSLKDSITGLSTVWADYNGIYSAKCTVSAEHSLGVIGPLYRIVMPTGGRVGEKLAYSAEKSECLVFR